MSDQLRATLRAREAELTRTIQLVADLKATVDEQAAQIVTLKAGLPVLEYTPYVEAIQRAEHAEKMLEPWKKLGGSVQAEDQQLQDLAKTLDIPPMPEDDGGHASTRVTSCWVIHVLDQRVTSLRTALAEQAAQLAHQTEVIAANQRALVASQSDCAAVLTERDALIEKLRAMLETCVGATVAVEVPQDPRYKHILSGDYYEPGKKAGA